jgi:quinolinate synthase
MSDNVAADNPGVEFVKPCNLCPHMKRISLENIYDALVSMKHEVLVPEDIRIRARAAIDAMLALGAPAKSPRFKVGDGVRVPVEII